jgi:signal transduction histidine kinase
VPTTRPDSSSLQLTWKFWLLKACLAAIAAASLSYFKLESVESWLYDARVRYSPSTSPSEIFQLVLITNKTLKEAQVVPGIRSLQKTLNKILDSNPKVVLINFPPTDLDGTPAEKKDFADTFKNEKRVHFTRDELRPDNDYETSALPPPYEDLQVSYAPKTYDRKSFAKDGVTRRLILSYQGRTMLQKQLALNWNPSLVREDKLRGVFNFYGANQVYVDFRPANTYPSMGYHEVLTADPVSWENKIVILGFDSQRKFDDYIMTPHSRDATYMNLPEMQANMIDTLVQGTWPVRFSEVLSFILTFLISLITIHGVLVLRPSQGLLLLGGLMLGYTLWTWSLYAAFRWWWPLAHPLLAVFLCYYFFIPYRLIIENRRSWEYYQKNKLLRQVEELKTNFISMMSHDLKTPIARIQGMLDVILKDAAPLSHMQRDAVDMIKQSSDDLLKFINSILNYAKIESEGVELHRSAKDINQILEDVIRKHEFLAKVKKIQIQTKLEPLFPIPVDADLVRQIFSNLIENAIKYSPDETSLQILSEEKESLIWVRVKDQGPGIPEDELPYVFSKFFRSKNAKSSPIKGSGLGLYLARYFTELHGGEIFVESTYGNGTTFTIKLPTS